MATEINGQGSRAAAEAHRCREQGNGAVDRKIVEAANNQLLAWLTGLNFTEAAKPLFQFYDDTEVRKDWVEVFSGAREFMDIPVKFAYEQLQIPMPRNGEAVIPRSGKGLLK